MTKRVASSDPSPDLRDPAVMLATLKTAYMYVLDHASIHEGYGRKRLTYEEEKELGKRLALYWMVDDLAHPINRKALAARKAEVNPFADLITEGKERRGGVGKMPSTSKPSIKLIGQKPAPSRGEVGYGPNPTHIDRAREEEAREVRKLLREEGQ